MYLIDKKQQLKDFAAALAIPVGLTDNAKWPVRSGTVIYPVRNILVREFIEQVESSDIRGNPGKWREAFDGPTQIWRTSHHLINGLTDDGIDNSVIAEKIMLLLEGIAALNNDHYFERLGKHIILNEEDVEKAAGVDLITDKKLARKPLLLSGLLWAYSEANYFVAHELTCEYHGAYLLHNGNYAVIREFKNLRPNELWSERDFDGIPQYIRVITIHDKSLDISFDAYNNLFDEKGTLGASLLTSAVIADGVVLQISEIDSLIQLFSGRVRDFTDEVNEMSKNDIARKYLEIFWYRKKSLTDYMGIEWKPSDNLYKILDDGLAAGPPPKKAQKSDPSLTPVERLTIDYDFSNYVN
jgi:hypothetical protein